MSQMSEVTDLLIRTDQDFDYTQRRSRRTKVLLCAILGPFYVAAIVGSVFLLVRLWQGADPLIQFWVPFTFSISFAIHLTRFFVACSSDSRAPLFAPVAAFRQAIHAGDITLAPLATDDSPPALDLLSATATNRIGPLRRPMKWSNPFVVRALTLLVAAILVAPPTLAAFSVQAGMILGVALLLPTAISCLFAYRTVGPVHVRVDADGLRWPRLLGGYHRLLWRGAQSLIQFGDVSMFIDDRKTTFILYGAKRVFTWQITGGAWRQRARVASQSLLRALSQHTGLPLRDTSAEVRRLAYQVQDPIAPHKLTS